MAKQISNLCKKEWGYAEESFIGGRYQTLHRDIYLLNKGMLYTSNQTLPRSGWRYIILFYFILMAL